MADEHLQLVLDVSRTGLWTWDMRSGAVTWDATCHCIHGVPEGGFDGTVEGFFALVHPLDRARVDAAVRGAIARRELYECEFRILRPDGSVVWVSNRGRAQDDEAGQPAVVLGTLIDISPWKAAEQRLQVALEASGTGTFRWDIRTDALWWDAALDKLFGLEPGQQVQSLDGFLSRVHPDDRDEVVARCARCREHAEDFEMEFRVVHPDGSVHWLYDRGRTLVDSSGRALSMTGACVDFTERRQAREALRRSEVFYRRTLESMPGITFSTTEAGDCDYLSSQLVAYTGVAATTYFGQRWAQALHPDDVPAAVQAWQAATRNRTPYAAEYRLRRHDGAYEWFQAHAHLIEGIDGLPPRWIGTMLNINDLKLAQARVAERERELQGIADHSPDVIARFDRQYRHVFVSAAAERLTGKPAALFKGRTNRQLGLPEVLCDYWEAGIEKVFTGRQPVTLQFELDLPAGRRHFATRLVPEINAAGIVDHVLGVTRDTTEAWEAQEALRRADREKDAFLATLAHELRNPLAPVRTGIGVLQRGVGEREQGRLLSIMGKQVEHMVRLIDELLEVARIGQGKIVLRQETLAVREVLDQAVDAARPLIEARGHDFAWTCDDALWVHGDLTRLAQVVANLLTNAAKYTPTGGKVRLRATREAGEACLCVEDDGIGIPRDMLGRVFERFVQVPQSIETSHGGLGIGLSVVRSLVDMHGGRVAADSAGVGCGTRVRVWLPLCQPEAGQAAARAPMPIATTGTPRRVLIVDDNADAAETLAMLATMHGHDARLAHDGAAALLAAREHEPEIVFLDIGMPGMSGYEVARELRALPGWGNRLLVALTGWGTEEDRARSLAAGFDVHLAKPVDLAMVEQLLAGAGR